MIKTDQLGHYHICNGCDMESSPDECVEDAEDCEDLLCNECSAQERKEQEWIWNQEEKSCADNGHMGRECRECQYARV